VASRSLEKARQFASRLSIPKDWIVRGLAQESESEEIYNHSQSLAVEWSIKADEPRPDVMSRKAVARDGASAAIAGG